MHRSTGGGDIEITNVGYVVYKVLHWFDMDHKAFEWLWALGENFVLCGLYYDSYG